MDNLLISSSPSCHINVVEVPVPEPYEYVHIDVESREVYASKSHQIRNSHELVERVSRNISLQELNMLLHEVAFLAETLADPKTEYASPEWVAVWREFVALCEGA